MPYMRRVSGELKIDSMMLKSSRLAEVHLSPRTLPTMSVFAVLSRLESPNKTAVTILEKMRAYDGQMVRSMSQEDVAQTRSLGCPLRNSNPYSSGNQICPRKKLNHYGVTSIDYFRFGREMNDAVCPHHRSIQIGTLWTSLRNT